MNCYYNPVHTIQGPGSLAQLPALLHTLPAEERRVLVLAWSKEALCHPVLAGLLAPGGECTAQSLVFTASNPTVEQLFDAWRATQAFAPHVVIGVGGGTILDVAKSLCCLYGTSLQSPDDLRARIAAGGLTPAARWIGVPTTAGTGSEVTCWATIWDPEKDAKRSLESKANYAWAALVDPELAQGMPVRLAVSSALDAVAHAVESYWARSANAVSRALALEAIRTIMGNIDDLFSGSLAAHDAMARGSMLAGLAFSNTKTTACHSISYPLTMHYHIPHGAAVAMLLAPVLALNTPAVQDPEALLDALGVNSAAMLLAPVLALNTPAVQDPEALLDALGVNSAAMLQRRIAGLLVRSAQPASLEGWGVDHDDLPHLAALGITKGRADNNPVALTPDCIESLLESIYQMNTVPCVC